MRVDHEDTYKDDDMRVHYEDDLFTGEVAAHNGAGTLIALMSYVDGVPSGPHATWYPNGQKREEGTMRWGIAVGEWHAWHSNGQLAEHSVFNLQGKRERRQRWDKEGNLTKDNSPQ
ncbi:MULTISPECIES: toxin-antitoxin system YwqK family antitoxin [Streptomyces]|uniref:Toxin-antitoxin system YwqK family antitoxin n=1 Tax=Streptomyces ramulosus TaxID=47762 RepID=A0ABW1FKB2_9ACTN